MKNYIKLDIPVVNMQGLKNITKNFILLFLRFFSFCSFFLKSLFSVISTTASDTPCILLSSVEGGCTGSGKHMGLES